MALGDVAAVAWRAAAWQPPADVAGAAWVVHAPLLAVVLAAVRPQVVLDASAGTLGASLAQALHWVGAAATVCVPPAPPQVAPDVLYVDAEALPPGGLAAALAHWRPLLAPHAVVLVHGVAAQQPQWAALAAQQPHFLATAGQQLGVLALGQVPEGLQWLLGPVEPAGAAVPPCRADALAALWGALGAGAVARTALLALQAQSVQWQQQAFSLQQEHAAAVRAQQQMQQQLAQVQQQLAQVYASGSWRVTQPLRAGLQVWEQARQHAAGAQPAPVAAAQGPQGAAPAAVAQQALECARSALQEVARVVPVPLGAFPLRTRWYAAQRPQVSLIVLNYNKPQLTLECVESIWRYTEGWRYEVVLVDNGSSDEALALLEPLAVAARLVRVGVNRFFGEGNNLGFEASRGRYVVFLNNDVTVTPGWLAPLIDRLEADATMGATGPMMVYPDGRLQEAGAQVLADGSSEQFGKGGNPDDPAYAQQRDVGYVSAAALAMRRETFARVLGFDLCYEPAYYEDSDLCMKIRQLGLRIVYCPDVRVVHHENATSRDVAAQLAIHAVIRRNREQFVARWGAVLRGEATQVPGLLASEPLPAQALHVPGRPSVVLSTPYPLVPGGGERYLLTVAAGLARTMNVTLATEFAYSRLRLLKLGQDLGLDLTHVALATVATAARMGGFDWSVALGNYVFPSQPALARRNVFICQFPFPSSVERLARDVALLAGYERVVLYSPFVARHYQRELLRMGIGGVQTTVVQPSAVLAPPARTGQALAAKRPQVVSVGRFFVDGHAKRHDFMIEAFPQLHARCPEAVLHLAGSLHADPRHMAYYEQLVEQAQGLPVLFHVNAAPETLAELYAHSSVYWHAAGVGVDELLQPHLCEHFGITVVEAMSAGCVPLVYQLGGPAATVQHQVTGYVYANQDELVEWTQQVLSAPADDEALLQMRAAAVQASRVFSDEALMDRFTALLA